MEETFGGLEQGGRDRREVMLGGRVLTARRLGSVLFLSVDSVTSFTLFPPPDATKGISSNPESTAEASPPAEDIFNQFQGQTGEVVEISQHSVLQVVLTKEDFKGEVRERDQKVEINESLKELSRTIAMSHNVGILFLKQKQEKEEEEQRSRK